MDTNDRIKIANTHEIPEGGAKKIILSDQETLALFHVNGKFYALNDKCPHQGGPLSEGEIEDITVTCPWHGWQFALDSGECFLGLCDQVKTYPLVVEGDEIFLISS